MRRGKLAVAKKRPAPGRDLDLHSVPGQGPAFDDEGETAEDDDARVIREADKHGKFTPLKTFLRRHGR